MELKEALKYLEEISFYLELKGENVFKINAFNSAIRNLSQINKTLDEGLGDGSFEKVKGVGKSILSILKELNESGGTHVLTELRNEFPESIYELTRIPGLGAKKIKKLYDNLQIGSIDELEQACIENRLIKIQGFGEKSQSTILANIERISKYKGFLLLHKANQYAQEFEDKYLKTLSNKYSITGELRRSCEIISKIEFLVVPNDDFTHVIKNQFELVSESPKRIEIEIEGTNIILHLCDEKDFYQRLFTTTGPEDFISKVDKSFSNVKRVNSEEELFTQAGLHYIVPQLRDNEKIEWKEYDFAEQKDLRGLLHIHTNYSDGINSIEEIQTHAEKVGYEFVLICDHSKSAVYANGLTEERVKAQWKEIDDLNKKNAKVKILKGIECDILADGSLDYSNDFLSKFDCVVASVHSNFNLSESEMTNRICKALENKYVKILGHLSGRLLLSRESYKVDVQKVIDAAAKFNKVIELNADPHRLDLDWRWHQYAVEKSVKIAISPDAHSLKGIDNVAFGLEIAKKGGLEKNDIINTLNLNSFVKQYCQNFEK
ncbi:MAG: PHP domain-containing protein [Bacteroidetes bacterium]|nr:PHP domain-containing protein [Bacteroidota bacterium]